MTSNWRSYLKKAVWISLSIFLLLPALWCCFSAAGLFLSWNPFIIWSPKQILLAREMGVRINDYPYPSKFPVSYFRAKLVPGTSLLEVHKIIVGYRKVLRCRTREVYYYFSSEERFSLRFEVQYNDDLTVKSINGEDEDSRTILTSGCARGLIEE